ncbi:MAG: HIT family protein [Nitrospirales bacterium]|nr:MAG: HIT family protein [Nitrospirales bacterium]
MNETLQKFGDPETRLKIFKQWVVLLRPQQITLGSLVIVCKEDASAFSELSAEAFVELREVTQYVEGVLARTFSYEKINYLMLMMVDPDVHFHVIPRYSGPKLFAEQEFLDHGWPGPPNFKQANTTSRELNQLILSHLKSH